MYDSEMAREYFPYSKNMYTGVEHAQVPTYWEASFSPDGPEDFDPKDYTGDVPLGNTDPTNVQGRIYETPGNTPLNTPRGPLRQFRGKYT